MFLATLVAGPWQNPLKRVPCEDMGWRLGTPLMFNGMSGNMLALCCRVNNRSGQSLPYVGHGL